MKVVAVTSGGKDSCFSMLQCNSAGHEIVALANLQPPIHHTEIDSMMFQSVGQEAIDFTANAMSLPIFKRTIEGIPLHQDILYEPTDGDEIEDLYLLLSDIKVDE